jgi:hypothetical protein
MIILSCNIHVLVLALAAAGKLLVLVMLHLGHGFHLDTAGCYCISGMLHVADDAR